MELDGFGMESKQREKAKHTAWVCLQCVFARRTGFDFDRFGFTQLGITCCKKGKPRGDMITQRRAAGSTGSVVSQVRGDSTRHSRRNSRGSRSRRRRRQQSSDQDSDSDSNSDSGSDTLAIQRPTYDSENDNVEADYREYSASDSPQRDRKRRRSRRTTPASASDEESTSRDLVSNLQDRIDDYELIVQKLHEERYQLTHTEAASMSSEDLAATKQMLRESLQVVEDEESNRILCIVCCDRKRDTLFLPCRHLVSCVACANVVQTCPVCRKRIGNSVIVYS